MLSFSMPNFSQGLFQRSALSIAGLSLVYAIGQSQSAVIVYIIYYFPGLLRVEPLDSGVF